MDPLSAENTLSISDENKYNIELTNFLFSNNALKFGRFLLSSGIESSYYIDLRLIPSFPYLFRKTILAMRDFILSNKYTCNFDMIGTVPTSGLIFGSSLAYEIFKPLIYVRKESKDYGTSRLVEGKFSIDSKILIVDDVATTGSSVIKAINHIRDSGGVVENVLVIVDRLESARRNLQEIGVNLMSITDISKLTKVLFENKKISINQLEDVKSQIIEKN